MLVSDNKELSTSVTLGASKASAMGFSSDSNLLIAMISTLYSNQKKAFCRETIANMWDAHIASNRKDVPIRITMSDDNTLVFRDYGFGIPKEKMEELYNTLGGTTKDKDDNQTGGFGLGCKSPLAYVDTFKVITNNNGTKSIYNMARSAVELDGKPGLVHIMDLPTEENGVEITINFMPNDRAELTDYILNTIHNGEINALFNGEPVELLGMSDEVGSYSVERNKWHKLHMGNSSIFIRYGSIVYPMLVTPATQRAYDSLVAFMDVVRTSGILIQAKPSSLAVSPSRETLSSQQLTEDSLVDLLVSVVDKYENDLRKKIPDAIEKTYEDEISNMSLESLTALKWVSLGKHCNTDYSVYYYINSTMGLKRSSHEKPALINRLSDHYFSLIPLPANYNQRGKLKNLVNKAAKDSNYVSALNSYLNKGGYNKLLSTISSIPHKKGTINYYAHEKVLPFKELSNVIRNNIYLRLLPCSYTPNLFLWLVILYRQPLCHLVG